MGGTLARETAAVDFRGASYDAAVRLGLFFLATLSTLVACGGRTELGSPIELDGAPPNLDATIDHKTDAPLIVDAGPDLIEPPDAIGVQCTQGVLTQYPTSECGADQTIWFATPYTPPSGIWVDRLEAYMAQGSVALLTDNGGAPGAVLFEGSVGTSNPKAWIGANVNPPVWLQGGVPYWIGFQGDCSFASNGPEPPEYIAPSINGPWQWSGTDNWTARLIGTCP